MTSIIGGCNTTQQRIDAAGAQIGAAAATVQLEPWPAYCRTHTPHAPVRLGDEKGSIVKAERTQLDVANEKVDNCAAYYEGYRRRLAGGK